jgi:hypothetical protein
LPIETIAPGDAVLTRDERTGETLVSQVVQTFTRSDAPLLRLLLLDERGRTEELYSTHGHPFWTAAGGWVRADQLVPGDLLSDAGDGVIFVLEVEPREERASVYNFEVAGTHSYFVGELEVWVHNLGGSLILAAPIDELTRKLARLRLQQSEPSSSEQAAALAAEIAQVESELQQQDTRRVQPSRPGKRKYEAPTVVEKKGKRPAPQPGHSYPKQDNLPWYKRKAMSNKVTKQTIERDQDNPDRTQSGGVMAVDQQGKKPKGMKKLDISRNHIIADSTVARLLTEAAKNTSTDPALRQQQLADVDRFIDAAMGSDIEGAEKAKQAFRKALKHRDADQNSQMRSELNNAIDLTSAGRNNVRFDNATLNGHILHGADYELQNGRPSQRAQDMRDATLGLARHGAVTQEQAFDAVRPTFKEVDQNGIRRGQYLSSSNANWAGDMQDPDTLTAAPRRDDRRAGSEPPPTREPHQFPLAEPRTRPANANPNLSDRSSQSSSDTDDSSRSSTPDTDLTDGPPPRKRQKKDPDDRNSCD